MRLYFVRHGESEANVLNVISNRGLKHGLTVGGRSQAGELAVRLTGMGATTLYTSPLLRAVETADILSQGLGLEVQETDALREFDCGIAEGRSDANALRLHRQLLEDWLTRGRLEAKIEGGESFLEMRDRFVPFVEHLVRQPGPGSALDSARDSGIVMVGHGGLYQCLLPLILINVVAPSSYPFPHASFVLAETRYPGLVCLEWCGQRLENVPL